MPTSTPEAKGAIIDGVGSALSGAGFVWDGDWYQRSLG